MFHTAFEGMNLNAIADEFGSPVYLYDINAIVKRYHEIHRLFNTLYSPVHVAVSYKTCPLLGILLALHQAGAKAEVVSDYEFDIAQLMQQQLSRHLGTIVNGPHKTDRLLRQAILDGERIHVDHHDEFARIEGIAKAVNKKAYIGVRISLGEHWNRFGFPAGDDFWPLCETLQSRYAWLQIEGIHLHIGTAIRSPDTFREASQTLAKLLQSWPFQWPLKWLDLGGGLAGISPKWEDATQVYSLPSIEDYALAWMQPLADILERHKPEIILEPGRTLFEPFGSLLSKVITCRERSAAQQTLVIDAGINALPTARVYRHPIHAESSKAAHLSTKIYGPLCLQADTLADDCLLPTLDGGDFILIKGIGAYNQSRSVPFIQLRPGVVGLLDEQLHWLRKPETLSDHLHLERWPH
ncbi:MAG: hypothetical protein KBT88_11305 [Gammaproteobacteria bacterium]|nr:hypothetical protein [Gammaproteobacteria bacterium]MBQ0840362.1 hypothetical protein [Gammaproteobacteria bacterium]